jgi:hypothetical protein
MSTSTGTTGPRGVSEHVSLCEALDRILNKGAVVAAEITISVADVELIYLSLQALVTSVDTGRRLQQEMANDQH